MSDDENLPSQCHPSIKPRNRKDEETLEKDKKEKIEINRILGSLEGKIDNRLIKLTLDVIMKTKWSQDVEKNLYRKNIDAIPQKAVDAMLLGSHVGQIYQISLDFAKRLEINLNSLQKSILREFVFFMVLIRTDKEKRNNQYP